MWVQEPGLFGVLIPSLSMRKGFLKNFCLTTKIMENTLNFLHDLSKFNWEGKINIIFFLLKLKNSFLGFLYVVVFMTGKYVGSS